MNQPPTHDLMRVPDVCALLSISRSTLYTLQEDAGFPPAIRISSRAMRWRRAEVEAWLRTRPSAGAKR